MSSNIFPSTFRPATITTFLNNYIAEKLMVPDFQATEIELRLGTLIPKNPKTVLPFIEKISYQSPIMVNHTLKQSDQSVIKQFTSPFEQESFYFDPNIDSASFYTKKTALDKFVSKDLQSEELVIDFLIGKDRYQWEVSNGKFYMNSKANKENIDLVNLGVHLRLSTAKEAKVAIDFRDFFQKFSYKSISLLRIKFRNNYDFQFIRFSLTKTYQVKSPDVFKLLFDELVNQIDKNFDISDVINIIGRLFKVINQFKLKYQYEVEAEIIDNLFLQNFIKSNNIIGFNACIDRFFRNVIMLHIMSDNYQWTEYERILIENNKPVVKPIIGKYLETINSQNY